MRRLYLMILVTALVAALVNPCLAQGTTEASDTSQVVEKAPPPTKAEKQKDSGSARDKIYFGGSVGVTFGNYTSIRISPLVGYKVQPKLSVGLQAGYEYVRDSRYSDTYTSHNFGGSVFSRYRVTPQLFAHAEYALINYEIHTSSTTSERQTVPFLFLGGGYSQRIGPATWAYVQVLFDLLQSNKSPYDNWEPFVSFGVGIGF